MIHPALDPDGGRLAKASRKMSDSSDAVSAKLSKKHAGCRQCLDFMLAVAQAGPIIAQRPGLDGASATHGWENAFIPMR